MYPLGLLFGLGFDTASEVALLVIAGGAGAAGLPWYAILCLPILFAAGMSLMDSIDGSFMNFAYGWALSNPVRKVYYNLTITSLSVAVALVIGTIEIGGLVSTKLDLSGSLWSSFENVDVMAGGLIFERRRGRLCAVAGSVDALPVRIRAVKLNRWPRSGHACARPTGATTTSSRGFAMPGSEVIEPAE